MGRTPCCEKVGLNRGPWTPEEDLHLSNYVETHGEGGWRTLPKKAGLLRCGKSCRLRWMNYLRPDVKRGKILPEEEDLILRLHRLLGNRWSLIAGRMPGRTDNEIKNYWNTHLSKKLITQGIDPRTHKPLSVMDNLCGTSDESDISPNSPVGSPVNENISVLATATEKEGESPPHAVNDINTEASYVPLSPALDFSIDNQFPLLPTLVNSGDLGTPFQQNVENIGSNQINLAPPFLTGNSGAAHHQSTENFNLEIRRQWSSSQASLSEDSSFHGCSIVPTAYNKLSNTNCSNTAFTFPYLTTTTTCIGSGFGDGSSSMFSSLLESFANEEWAHVTCAQNPANLSYDLSSLLSPNSQFHPSK